jgi:hypothetical protein
MERQHYEQALKQVRDLRQTDLSFEQGLTVALYEGLILASMRPSQQREAVAAFRSALRQDPQVRLPLKVPSRLAREFEELRAQVLAEKHAALLSSESGAPPLGVVLPPGGVSSTHVLIPTLAGGGLVASGGVFWALSRKEKSRLENADPALTTDEELRRFESRGKTYQTLGFSLLGAGAAGLGIATTLYLRRKSQASMTLGVGVNGPSVVAYGRWP